MAPVHFPVSGNEGLAHVDRGAKKGAGWYRLRPPEINCDDGVDQPAGARPVVLGRGIPSPRSAGEGNFASLGSGDAVADSVPTG